MKNLYSKLLLAVMISFSATAFAQSDLVLTGVFDGPLSGGTPKALEIYVINDISDLSIYGIANANNGGASGGVPIFTFPDTAVTAGSYLYTTSVAPEFNTYFGFDANFVANAALSVNGDDVIELYQNGTVVDVIGETGVDGSGTYWEYMDGWMYRNNGAGPNATFTESEWTFSGINVNDNQTTNETATDPWPIGTYSPEGGEDATSASLNFDGSEDYIQTSFAGILGDNARTVEAWIKPNHGGEKVIAAWGSDAINGHRFTFRVPAAGDDDVIRVEIKGGGMDGTVNVSDGDWHHVAVTYDPDLASNKYKLFVDGALDTEGDMATPLNVTNDVDFRIGRRINTTFTGFFSGDIDEVRVWSVARTEAELAADMNTEICSTTDGLAAYYKFNEGTPDADNTAITAVIDALAGNDGTFMAFALDGTTSNYVDGSGITPNDESACESAPTPATIVEIQQTSDESGDSPMTGQMVVTNGIVTAVDDDGFWIQDGSGAWTGLYIEQDAPTVAQGDDVDVTGEVEEHYGLTQLTNVTDVTVNSSGNGLPAASVLTTGTAGVEDYESVLISIINVTCTNNDLGFGEWMINDGSGDYTVDDDLYNANPESFMGYDVAGVSTYSFDVWKLLPRDAADVVANPAFDALGLSLEDSEISVNETAGTVTVNVSITNPAATETTVDVVVTGGTAVNGTNYTFTDPTTLTFPANSTEAQSFSFDVINDADENEDRTIMFALQNATNDATIGTGSLDVTITDDDAVVVITDIAVAAAVDVDGVAINNGTEYTVTGLVYGVNMNAAGLSFTVNDLTGGIGFYSGTPVSDYTVTEGDSVVITGVVNQFNGLTQMTPSAIELISQGNTLADPIVTTELNENLESHLVKIECVYLADASQWTGAGSGFNVTVTNGTDDYAVRIDNDVDLYSAPAPTGTFNVSGIVGQYDSDSPYLSGYQLFPRYVADIEAAECGITQPPVNDNCNSGIDLSSLMGGPAGEMQTSGIYTNVDATSEGDPETGFECFGEPDGGGATPSLENTVWFSFVGDGNTYFIETTNCDGTTENYIPDGDTQIAIYSGLCAIPSPEACNEDGPNATTGSYEAGLEFETVPGQTYHMLIDGFGGVQGQFCVAFTRQPVGNDDCDAAINLNALTGGPVDEPQTSTIYTNVGATSVDDPNPNDEVADCWFGTPLQSHTVWFHFTGDGDTYFIETTDCSGTSAYMPDGDSQMAIFTGDCNDLTQVACNEDGPNATTTYEAAIQITTEMDVEYYVMIDGYADVVGQFCMQMTHLNPEAVDQINAFNFEVYPNPSHDRFNIDSQKIIEAATLTNLLGQQVRTYSFNASQRVELNVNGISSGIYLLELRSGNQISTTKVVVE